MQSAGIEPGFADVAHQDRFQVDAAEADRQEHVRRDQSEGEDAGDETTVHLQRVHHPQQWRN